MIWELNGGNMATQKQRDGVREALGPIDDNESFGHSYEGPMIHGGCGRVAALLGTHVCGSGGIQGRLTWAAFLEKHYTNGPKPGPEHREYFEQKLNEVLRLPHLSSRPTLNPDEHE